MSFRIFVGTYERSLIGLDVTMDQDNVEMKMVVGYCTHIGYLKSIAVGGQFLASGSTDEVIKLYDLKRKKELGSLHNHNGSINCLAFHSNTHLISGGADGTLIIYRTKDFEPLKILKNCHSVKGSSGDDGVMSVSIHPTGKLAVSVGADRIVKVWDLTSARTAYTSKLDPEGLEEMCMKLHEPDWKEKRELSKMGRRNIPEKIIWNHEGTRYAVMFENRVLIFHLSTQNVVIIKTNTARMKFNDVCFVFLDDKEWLLTGSEDGILRYWDMSEKEEEMTLQTNPAFQFKIHDTRIKALEGFEWNARNLLVSIASDGKVCLWDLQMFIQNQSDITPLGQFDTASRLTCLAVQKKVEVSLKRKHE